MKIKIEKRKDMWSVGFYKQCVVTTEKKDVNEKDLKAHPYKALDDLFKKVRKAAGKRLKTDQVDLDYMMTAGPHPWEYIVVLRRRDYENEIRESLKKMGFSEDDIDDGKSLPFTNHTGLTVNQLKDVAEEESRKLLRRMRIKK